MPGEQVLEVARRGEGTAVPGSRPQLLGVRNMRGQILPVVDLALLLGVPRTAPPTRLLVAEAGGRQAGFAIDQVSEVGELADPTEETASDLLAGRAPADGDPLGAIAVTKDFAAPAH